MKTPATAILHYTAPPVVGGVEAVIEAHAQTFLRFGYPVTIVTGWGKAEALPPGTDLLRVPEMDSQYAQMVEMSSQLELGDVPAAFDAMANRLQAVLVPILSQFDSVIVHNVFTKHFNLPLTAALHHLLDAGTIRHCIAWCHDLTWTSPSSRSKVHSGYPWDLLRSYRPDVTYIAVSEQRRSELAGLFGCPPEKIRVIYNGVDPQALLGLSMEGQALVDRLELLACDLVLLMPVRVTQAKNIEYALQVVAALKERGSKPKLILTGPPDPHDAESMAYFRTLQALRRQLGVEEEMRFVFESGPDPDEATLIDAGVVGDLFRVSDLMFMPSHREGFAMPVLEAGLVGVPVICTEVPAAVEIGSEDVILVNRAEEPAVLAERILAWAAQNPVHRLRRRVRQSYTWQAIFEREIKPLLPGRGMDDAICC
ncbi:MAG TPA: glycosyltransferase family 4 protein [Anaerolineae bacterium]|nr:glycosyltransferase family 4 protein [Anaerolineae bacterium]